MPMCMVETPQGDLFLSNGINPVLKWDGTSDQAIPAGVVAPTTAVSMSSSGLGNIVGDYYAYVRFVDQDGNVGNLSPVSTKLTVGAGTGTITDATDARPIVITSAAHGLLNGSRVLIENVGGNTAANGSWTITVLSLDTFSLDDSDGNGSYIGGGSWSAGRQTISYTSVPTSQDPTLVGRQILRNTAGQTNVFYIDVELSNMTATTASSTKDDATLVAQTGYALLDPDGRILANRFGLPPNHKSVLASHLDRMYAAVDEPYAEGNVQVSAGSTTVTGIGTEWTEEMEGRFLFTSQDAYEIDSVDVANQTLTLTSAYTGSTDLFAAYSIRSGTADANSVYFSGAGEPHAFRATDILTLQEDGDTLTGLMPKASYLFLLKRRHIYRLVCQSDPIVDGAVFLNADRGCINNRCWVNVEDVAYMLDEAGIHAFASGSEALSSNIADLWEEDSDLRINWKRSKYFHAVHFPGQEVIRWFVCLSGARLPRHAICLHLRSKRWWIEEFAQPVGASCKGYMQSRARVFLGTQDVLAYWMGSLDGPDPTAGTLDGTVTGASWLSLTDSTAAFATDVVGAPVVITGGRGKGQRRLVMARSATRLDLDRPWGVLPDTTSTYQVGGIQFDYQTGWYRFARSEVNDERRVELQFEPQDAGTMDLRLYFDRDTEPADMYRTVSSQAGGGLKATKNSPDLVVDLSKSNGCVWVNFPGHKEADSDGPRMLSVQLRGCSTDETPKVHQITIEGVG